MTFENLATFAVIGIASALAMKYGFVLVERYWPRKGKMGLNTGVLKIACPECGPAAKVEFNPSLDKQVRGEPRCKVCGSRQVPICPKCNSTNQGDRTISQIFWGGWTCGNCDTKWDKYGCKIQKSA